MRTTTTTPGLVVLGIIALGWLVGLATQRGIAESTSYLDVSPELLILGVILCGLGGAAARLLVDGHRARSAGALGGIATMGAIVAGYMGLAVAYRERFAGQVSDESWLSLILEAWIWIGLPVLIGAVTGAIGWLIADRLMDAGHGQHPAAQ